METLVFFSFSISFLIISIQLFRNKWLMLISGYNTMHSNRFYYLVDIIYLVTYKYVCVGV